MVEIALHYLPMTDIGDKNALKHGTFTILPVLMNILEDFGNPTRVAWSSWIVHGPLFMENLGIVTQGTRYQCYNK